MKHRAEEKFVFSSLFLPVDQVQSDGLEKSH